MFINLLTLILIAFKLRHIINWSWWLVLLPMIIKIIFKTISFGIYIYDNWELLLMQATFDGMVREGRRERRKNGKR